MRRSFLVLVALAAVSAGCATPTRTTTVHARLDHAALHVADLARSIDFYERVFGVDEIETPGDPAVIRWVALDNGTQLHFIHYDGDVPPTTRAVHFALGVPDLDAFVSHVVALGVPYSNWPGEASTVSVRGDGVRQVYIQDPDGYWIEVNDIQ